MCPSVMWHVPVLFSEKQPHLCTSLCVLAVQCCFWERTQNSSFSKQDELNYCLRDFFHCFTWPKYIVPNYMICLKDCVQILDMHLSLSHFYLTFLIISLVEILYGSLVCRYQFYWHGCLTSLLGLFLFGCPQKLLQHYLCERLLWGHGQ